MAATKTILSWSSGKDSAWALHGLRRDPGYDVVGLLTTVNRDARRVAMHAVRREVLAAQAGAVGLPLFEVPIPSPCPNEVYEAAMAEAIAVAQHDGIEAFAFGDLYLEDVRRYREEKLLATGMSAVFPLWGKPTANLAQEMVAAGLRAVLTCVDPKQLDPSFVGRSFDQRLLAELPPGVDLCGENGEFHTLVHDGPMFAHPLTVVPGEVVTRGGFVFADMTLVV